MVPVRLHEPQREVPSAMRRLVGCGSGRSAISAVATRRVCSRYQRSTIRSALAASGAATVTLSSVLSTRARSAWRIVSGRGVP